MLPLMSGTGECEENVLVSPSCDQTPKEDLF